MKPWSKGTPTTIPELFEFYHTYVKLLYSSVQTQNALPDETLFEINAAFDHLSRHWVYNEQEQDVVNKAFSHLKRSCLDIFKLKVREARNQYDQLLKIDTSAIDNGDFDQDLHQLFNKIRKGATEARRLEGEPDPPGDSVPAFDRWESVFVDCVELETEYFHHKRIKWAKRRKLRRFLVNTGTGILIGIIGGVLATPVIDYANTLRRRVDPPATIEPHAAPTADEEELVDSAVE